MDKDRRLRRYRRKDYSEIVGFPVEIVGRDRTVRQYDFEASIRLYQRRLTFVHVRFQDEDLAAAEASHCRARIEQLRRSFFHLHGWTTPPGERGFEVAHPTHAGELASLLLRVLGEDERLDVRVTRVGHDGEAEVWHVARGGGTPGLLAYAWFHGHDEAARARSRAALRGLAAAPADGDGERLIAAHELDDATFALTGRGADVVGLAAGVRDVTDPGEPAASPWEEACTSVRRGELAAALVRCSALAESQPWHRDAHVLGASLAVVLSRPVEAEELAFVGVAYVPGDPLLLRALGLARLHDERPADAVAPLAEAVAAAPDDGATRALLVLALGRTGRLLAAWRAARQAPAGSADRGVLDALVGVAVRGAVFGAVAFVTLGLVLAALVEVGWPALVPAAGWAIAVGAGVALFRRRVEDARRRVLVEDPAATLARLRRARRAAGGGSRPGVV